MLSLLFRHLASLKKMNMWGLNGRRMFSSHVLSCVDVYVRQRMRAGRRVLAYFEMRHT